MFLLLLLPSADEHNPHRIKFTGSLLTLWAVRLSKMINLLDYSCSLGSENVRNHNWAAHLLRKLDIPTFSW